MRRSTPALPTASKGGTAGRFSASNAARKRIRPSTFAGSRDPRRNALHAPGLMDRAKRVDERQPEVAAVAHQVDAGDHQFPVARFAQRPGLGGDLVQRHRAHGTAHRRNDAVGAQVFAAFLNLHHGAGMALVAPDGEALERPAVLRAHGADHRVFEERALIELRRARAVPRAQNQPHAGQADFFGVPLRQAPGHDDARLRMFAGDAADQLQGFLIADAGDGAGVDQVYVRRAVKGHAFIPRAFKRLPHRLGVVLIHLAAQRQTRDRLHGFPQRGFLNALAGGFGVLRVSGDPRAGNGFS